jgi:hypothetical protein
MSEKNKIIDTEIIGNIMVILSTSLIVCLIVLFYILDDSHASVMISIAISSFLVIGYWIYSFFRPKEEENNKKIKK